VLPIERRANFVACINYHMISNISTKIKHVKHVEIGIVADRRMVPEQNISWVILFRITKPVCVE
jgi:hypothetical protein